MHSTTHLGFYSRALVKQWRLPWLAEMHRQPDSVACNTQNMQVYDTRLIVNSTSYVYNHTYTYIGNSFTGHYPSSSSSPESTGGLIISHTSPRKPPWAATTVFLQVKCSTNSVTFKSELCTAFAHCAKLQLQIINLNTTDIRSPPICRTASECSHFFNSSELLTISFSNKNFMMISQTVQALSTNGHHLKRDYLRYAIAAPVVINIHHSIREYTWIQVTMSQQRRENRK